MKLSDLTHTTIPIKTGGEVIVLDTGAVIDSEAEAMLQALHSRSVGGLKGHLEVLEKKGAENFMANFYVGYGHKSIGDCGTATIFIEGVSMLAAKAVQDWPLYSGQEASTRYIDFQIQPFIDPAKTPESHQILETWRDFYKDSLEPLQAHLKKLHPLEEGEPEKTYNKAIAARAFDILRGFLPAGASTNLAWHTNLRQAADKLLSLRHHPLLEVRAVSEAIETALQEAYPNSFHHKRYSGTESYNQATMQEYYYHNPDSPLFSLTHNHILPEMLPRKLLAQRPEKTELPKWLAEAGTATFEFQLDFGSYRDIQRHRAVTQRMPLLTTELGFEAWYLESLPSDMRQSAETLLKQQKDAIMALGLSPEETQYYLPMGYKTANRLTGSLPALAYLVELRATRFVHPTLVSIAKQIGTTLVEKFSEHGLKLHLDDDPGRFDSRRGEHDIEIKD